MHGCGQGLPQLPNAAVRAVLFVLVPPPALHSNLMAPQDLRELGLSDSKVAAGKGRGASSREKTKRGFIAGLQ